MYNEADKTISLVPVFVVCATGNTQMVQSRSQTMTTCWSGNETTMSKKFVCVVVGAVTSPVHRLRKNLVEIYYRYVYKPDV